MKYKWAEVSQWTTKGSSVKCKVTLDSLSSAFLIDRTTTELFPCSVLVKLLKSIFNEQYFLPHCYALRLLSGYFHRQRSAGVAPRLPSLIDLGFPTTGNE